MQTIAKFDLGNGDSDTSVVTEANLFTFLCVYFSNSIQLELQMLLRITFFNYVQRMLKFSR